MTIQLSFKCINENYSQKYADEYQEGKESVNNLKHNWEKSFDVVDVKEVSTPKEAFILRAELEDGTQLQKEIKNVYILRVKFEEGQKDYAVSRALLKKTHDTFRKKEGKKRYYFYLNDEHEAVEVINGVYLTEEEAYGEGFVVV